MSVSLLERLSKQRSQERGNPDIARKKFEELPADAYVLVKTAPADGKCGFRSEVFVSRRTGQEILKARSGFIVIGGDGNVGPEFNGRYIFMNRFGREYEQPLAIDGFVKGMITRLLVPGEKNDPDSSRWDKACARLTEIADEEGLDERDYYSTTTEGEPRFERWDEDRDAPVECEETAEGAYPMVDTPRLLIDLASAAFSRESREILIRTKLHSYESRDIDPATGSPITKTEIVIGGFEDATETSLAARGVTRFDGGADGDDIPF